MVRWFTAANTKLWWSWIYVHYQSHKHFEFTKDYCLHSSLSLLSHYWQIGKWHLRFITLLRVMGKSFLKSKQKRRRKLKVEFQGCSLYRLWFNYVLFPGFRKMVRWRLCYFFPSSYEQLSISDTLNDFLKPKNLSCKTLVRRRLFLIGKKSIKIQSHNLPCRLESSKRSSIILRNHIYGHQA